MQTFLALQKLWKTYFKTVDPFLIFAVISSHKIIGRSLFVNVAYVFIFSCILELAFRSGYYFI